jgi:CBS-domain-containing membrane protein
MIARDVMNPAIIGIAPSATVAEAAHTMLERRISGLPVTEADGRLVGIVTEGDLLRRVELGTEKKRPRWLEFLVGPGKVAAEYAHSHGRTVAEVMTAGVVTVDETTDLAEVVRLMNAHGVKRLPVMAGVTMVGIVSRADLLRALEGMLERGAVEKPAGDAGIRAAILAELQARSWAPTATLHIDVKDGVVALGGCIFDDRERDALKVVAENVPGVKSVKDELATIEPYSGMLVSTGAASGT